MAAAQVVQLLTFIASAFAERGKLKTPKTSEVLESFTLPAMAEAMRSEEEVRSARAMVENLKSMAKKFGGKVEITERPK